MFYRCVFLVITSVLVGGSWSVSAQTCVPLKAIGGQGTQVKKSVSPPGLLVSRNNWNTDFAVPGGVAFRRFTATIIPSDDANYNIAVYLKYSNKTSDNLYNKNSVHLIKGQPLRISGSPRSTNQPYEVNVRVGGLKKLNNTYTVSAVGCP